MGSGLTLRINRAPVLTLWAAVVAQRRGAPWDAALTMGQTLAGLTAFSKGVRLGIYTPSEKAPAPAPPLPPGARRVHDVILLGRRIHVAETPDGMRAIAKAEVVKPAAVERYLMSRFGEALDSVRQDMEQLAGSFEPEELEAQGFHLYEKFRPEVPAGEKGWGAKGVLDTARIRALVKR